MEPEWLYYAAFLVFIIIAYGFYTRKNRRNREFFEKRREIYIREEEGLEEEKRQSLTAGHPWEGMDTELLVRLFGEPYRKRPMNNDASQTIWTYGNLFVLVESQRVITWKERYGGKSL